MPRPTKLTREMLVPLLRARGPVSATELAEATRTHRTTVVNVLKQFGDELVQIGATRRTRYVLRRTIRDIGNRWPVFRIDDSGRARDWAELESFHDRSWRIRWAGDPPEWARHFENENGLWSGFPFFLSDIRPQGFLGRGLAKGYAARSSVSDDLREWSDEDILHYLQGDGFDVTGNLIVGESCLRRALSRSVHAKADGGIHRSARTGLYPKLALESMRPQPGSSAGGEQPKFLANLQGEGEGESITPVIVKFSPPQDQPAGRRWRDLLRCEWHALEILAQSGLAHPGVEFLESEGRAFLEVARFDREGSSGRRGVVSMEALLHSTAGSSTRDWIRGVQELRDFVGLEAENCVRVLRAFGELIGNSDMHPGNLSFWFDDTLPFELAPAYDMLPMLWSPGPQGELIERKFAPQPPVPTDRDAWGQASEWAANFWGRVATDGQISAEFHDIATQAGKKVEELREFMQGIE